ncbi:MAG TPA: hypothetical protein VMH04_18535 [Candidatus Solibacter sp.]|nr:hypothetical protein [Candidatus Solibacter sp.]
MSKTLLILAIVCFLVGSGCTTPGKHLSQSQNLQAPQPSPKLLAVYMPWFGDHVHMDVGYSSEDTAVLRRQIHQARHMGIAAFVVDWYGESKPFNDHNFALLEETADESHFQVALLYNEAEDDDGQATEEAIASLDRAYKIYIGPAAPHRDAYLTYQGHPMIFIFPKHSRVDWNRVLQHCQQWETSPMFFYKDEPPAQYASDFAGMYAWVQPGSKGWTPDGSNWGEQYLDDFYKNMRSKHPDKLTVGAAWPGFDDSSAKWGLNRHMQERCGKTFDDTLRFYEKYYDAASPLPFLLIETWNDYEEGTAVERLNFTQCSERAASAASK